MNRIAKKDIRTSYRFGELIGSGQFGAVRIATRHNIPDKKFAIKSLARSQVEIDMHEIE